MNAAVDFEHITKTYAAPRGGVFHALQGVDLRIEDGEFFGLLGPNGAGKTTLISILAGLSKPSTGRARVHGVDVQDSPMLARKMLGIVPQELVFDPFFSVRETLKLQSGHFGVKNNGAWIDELLNALGLENKADANLRQLSGGMKRRVMVALALVHRPRVIVLDEPTAGVDVELRQSLWQFISRLNIQGHTVILTTHYLEEAQTLCQRIGVLRSGKIVALDTTQALLNRHAGSVMQFEAQNASLSNIQNILNMTFSATPLLVRENKGKFDISVENTMQVQQILQALHGANVRVEQLQIRGADLEDVFLRMMNERTA